MSNATIYLKDYLPPVFTVHTVSLEVDLYEEYALVSNQMVLERVRPGELLLHGDELELLSLTLNGQALARERYRLDGGHLFIPDCPDEARLTVVTRIYPKQNTQLSGLYRSHQLFCTQCEAEGFRRITFFIDRPDVLAKYTTKISADKARYPILLSNGNWLEAGDAENGRHWVCWQDPFKKPSYLFALVAGDLRCVMDQFTTCSGKIVELRIYVEPGNENKCDHAMAALKRAMRWDEEKYGREYDLDIFMIVAVSDFNMGAMENKGLNIFNSKYILARPDTATDDDFMDIEGVVAHEYFHNWTGNRVTCRDWFQLSLKEGLTVFRDQEFSRDMYSRDVGRILDVNVLRTSQFPEDAGRMAHPVRPASYQEINNFYTATIYNKGAEVIRMQHTLLKEEGFRRGMDLYFERHDGQAVTIDDFVRAMEDANGLDLTLFKRWYSQAGTPRVAVTEVYQEGCLRITFTQSCPLTLDEKEKAPFHIPIRFALFDKEGKPLAMEQEVLEIREKEETFYFNGLKSKPIVSLLRDFSAPVILEREWDPATLLALLRFETDGFAKWDAAQSLAKACIMTCYHSPEETWSVPQPLLDAYRHVLLDCTLDTALRAVLLTPPSYEEVVLTLEDIDVTRIEAARDFFRITVGRALFSDMEALYHQLWQDNMTAMDASAFGARKLRHVCLGLMLRGDPSRALSLCEQQFLQAKTMTDQITPLQYLVNMAKEPLKNKVLAVFYEQWKHEELVLDKWFTIQALAEGKNTLQTVKILLSHPAFTLKNPNKVRALVGAFTHNPRHFHAIDGSGYRFLTEMVMQLDKLNPHMAARLATPFTRWQCLDETRRALIKEELGRLAKHDLSRDVTELVQKSLS